MTNVRPKVVMVGPALEMQGGIAAVANSLIDGGIGDVCDLEYLATACKGSPIKKVLKYLSGLAVFRQSVKTVDIVHIHVSVRGSFRRKYEIARKAKAAGKKLVLHEHSGEFAEKFEAGNAAYCERVREFFGWADRVIVLSNQWRDYFASHICDMSKIVVIHNAVTIPSVVSHPSDHQSVLFLGRLGACKSPDVILYAAKDLQVRFPEVRYRFAGDGDIDTYRNLADELGVADQCDFVGWVNGKEKEQLILESGIFCLPSRHEGMPMSLLEMMAYGLPSVVTPVGGIPEVIDDGKNGYFIPVGNSKALAECLAHLLASPETRARVGVAARNTVVQCFDVKRNVQLLHDIYTDLL